MLDKTRIENLLKLVEVFLLVLVEYVAQAFRKKVRFCRTAKRSLGITNEGLSPQCSGAVETSPLLKVLPLALIFLLH